MHRCYLIYAFLISVLLMSGSVIFSQSLDTAPESSYLLLPSAYTPEKGQLYLENIAVGLFSGEYGVSKYLSAKVSFELFNPIFAGESSTLTLSPKVSFPISDNIRFGASFINIIGFDDGYIGIPHAVLTLGQKGKPFSIGYGHAFYNFFSVNTSYDGITIGGQYAFNDNWSVVTDNWILIGEPSDPFANDFDFFSLGLSKQIKDKFLLSFGLTYFTEDEDLGNNPWPYVKFSGYAHELFRKKENRSHRPSKPKVTSSSPKRWDKRYIILSILIQDSSTMTRTMDLGIVWDLVT